MNKVFKVIWSEARNAYVVVSEIAKNHGSKSCSTKKLLTMLIATGVMTCASMAPAMAAPNVDASATVNVGKKAAVTVEEQAKVNVKKNAKVNVEEGAELTVKNGAKVTFSKDAGIGFENGAKIKLGSKAGVTLADGAKLSVDKNITMGNGAVSSPYVGQTGNVAIGEKALAWNGNGLQEAYVDFGQGGAKVKTIFGFPYGAEIVDGTKLPGSIAIGKNTVARSGSTMIGEHGYTGKIGDTTITPDGNGIMKYNNDVYSTTIGANSFNSGAMASVTGVFSIASSKFDGGNSYKSYAVQNTGATIYGSMNSIESATSNSIYSGVASSVLGFANRTQNANAALIWGTGNEVTNSVEDIGIDTNWNNVSVAEAQQKAIKAMQSNQYAGGSVMAIGGGNKADYAKYSQLTGVQNKVTGTEAKAAQYDLVNGYKNTVTKASDVTVIGSKNEVTADGNKVIGDNHKVSGKNNVIFGSADEVTETTVNNSVALGHNAKVTGEGGVALGAGSVADRANAVSIGSKGAERQITNVAAGEADTDAVNVSQLKEATANANKGWKLSTEGGAENQVASEATVDFSGQKDAGNHQNITVSNDGNNVKIDLASELHNVTGVVNEGSRVTLRMNTAGINNGTAQMAILSDGIYLRNLKDEKKNVQIHGVANGEADKDAVNYGQLKDVKAEALKHSTVTNGDNNITVTEGFNKDGGKEYNVALKNDITLAGDDPDAFVSISGSRGTIWASGTVTAGSVAAGDVFMDGTNATVSGLSNKTTAYEGFATTGKAATEEQLKEVATEAGKHTQVKAGTNVSVVPGETADGTHVYTVNADGTTVSGDSNVVVTAGAKDANNVTNYGVKLNKNLQGIESVSNGAAKLALNSAAGYAGIINGKGASVYLQDGYTKINNKVIIDQDGKISGVAAGTADTDAVNVSQLKDVKAEALKHTTLSDGKNTTVEATVKDGQTDYKVNVAGDLTDITSVINGGAKLALNGEAGVAGLINGKGASVYLQDGYTKINNKVIIDQDGKISGVVAGTADTDAVNVSQLKKVSDTANAGWTLSTNGNATAGTNVTPGAFVDFSGDNNVSVSNKGTAVSVKLNNALKDIESISNGDAKLALNGAAGTAGIINGQGASVYMQGSTTVINSKVSVDKDGKISGVAAGKISADSTDAVNGSQLNAVATEAGKHSKVVNGNNTNVEETTVDGQKVYKVNLNNNIMVGDVTGKYVSISGTNGTIEATGAIATKDRVYADKGGKLADIDVTGNTISNGDAKLALDGAAGTAGIVNGKGASVYMQDGYTVINSKVSFDQDGKISGVAAGTADTDAVNVGQLKKVSDTANAGWNLSTNGVATEATNVKPGDNVDFSGDKNISVSNDGTKVKVELNKNIDVNYVQTNALNAKYNLSVGTANENGTVPFFVNSNGAFYGANGSFVVDKDGKVTATAGEIGNVVLNNGVFTGHSALRDGELFVGDASGNYSQITTKGAKLGKVTVAADGKISGVAAGSITADSTDAVNGSQLHAVATEAGKHSKVVSGNNINVEETDVDGQKFYKVNMNKDIILGDLTGKYVNISGTNGTIEATGAIATKDRVYADKGAKLADIDVTGNKISNGASSIVLDGSNVKVNDKVTIDQNGKISGVAAGEVSDTSTDAINGSQLKETNDRVAANETAIKNNTEAISKLDGRVTANETAIKNNTEAISKLDGRVTANETAIKNNAEAIGSLNTRVDGVEKLAKQHTTVTAGDNVTVTEDTNKDGGKEYKVALKKDINLDSVTTGQTVMNNDGLKVGDKVSVTATAVTAGKTSISDEGVKVGDKTYISDKGLNANDQKVTNVAAGEISATSKDAVNGSQLYKTNQEVVNNTNRINQLGSRVNKVGAGAAALAALHPMDFDPDDKLTFSAGYGNYGGENAAAIGAYYRPDEKVMFSVGGTVGNGENMVNAGVSFSLDRTNHVSNSRTAMAREILDLRAEVTELKAMVAKGGLGSIAEDKMKIFPDVAENHWAYEYVGKLAAAGIIEGYPDGNFSGDRMMSRYEFAAMLYRAMQKGAQLDSKIIKEFAPEMGRIRVDRISGEDGDRDKIERVRVNAVKGERDHYGNKVAKKAAK